MASNGLTYANVVDGAPGVVQNIFLSVLNGSKFLHETSNIESATKSVYFFAKKTGTSSDIAEALMASDMEAVNRLEGKYTVAVRPLKQRGKKFIDLLKFRFFMKATKHLRKKLIWNLLSKREILVTFCGLLRKPELQPDYDCLLKNIAKENKLKLVQVS